MTLITSSPDYIHQESVDKDSPLSEDLGKRMGASINYVLDSWDSIPVNFIPIKSRIPVNGYTSSLVTRTVQFVAPYDLKLIGAKFNYYTPRDVSNGAVAFSGTNTCSIIYNSSTICSSSGSYTMAANSEFSVGDTGTTTIMGDYGSNIAQSIASEVLVSAGDTITIQYTATQVTVARSLRVDCELIIVKQL